jgi:large subunit ribosomal protein L6
MSRIGRKLITMPKGVTVTVKDGQVAVKGPKGELKRALPAHVSLQTGTEGLTVQRADDSKPARASHGLARALVANMVSGVSNGFERKLEVNGVGYRFEVAGDKLTMALGYSHPVVFALPKGIAAKVEKNTAGVVGTMLILSGIDRELLGQTAAKVRSFKPPEPYKGKGIKYVEEFIKRKVGKTGAA